VFQAGASLERTLSISNIGVSLIRRDFIPFFTAWVKELRGLAEIVL